MKVFLFEYATCGDKVPESIVVEGLGMFKSLYEGFREISSVKSFVRPEFVEMFQLSSTKNWFEDFERCVEESDYTLVIAPEDDFILFELTKVVENASNQNTNNLGSSSKGVLTTSDKWLTYKAIKGKVNTPKTSLKPLDEQFIVKPRISCGGEGIGFSNDVPEGYIAQEFIEGDNVSVSLLVGDEIRVLSVNAQIIDNFRYMGAIVPYECTNAIEEAIKAVEAIDGLFGYVGVDLVVSDIPYVVDINPRITTPAILFRDVYGINLADVLIRNYEGKRIPEFRATRRLVLKKCGIAEKHSRQIVSFGRYSLIKYES
jgi:predicted ATP-grasp superfamily ATP-dependent carboligase